MENQDEAFNQRQLLSQKSIKKNREGGNSNNKHGAMPALKVVGRIIQDEKALDDGTG